MTGVQRIELLLSVLHEEGSAQQFADAHRLLESDAEARRLYVQLAQVHSMLERQSVRDLPAVPQGGDALGRGRRIGAVAAAIAAAVLLAVGVTMLLGRFDGAGAEPAVRIARVAATEQPVWEPADPPLVAGSWLGEGTLRLRSGSVQLSFRSGADVHLTGPAEFEIRSSMRGVLRRGRFTASVPPQARGFTIETPGIEVVDLGTEFGLDVQPNGRSRLHVIRGLVEARIKDARSSIPLQLTEGRSAEYDPHKDAIRETVSSADRHAVADANTIFPVAGGSLRAPASRPSAARLMTDLTTIRCGYPASWILNGEGVIRGVVTFPLEAHRAAIEAADRVMLRLHLSGRSTSARPNGGDPPPLRIVHLLDPGQRPEGEVWPQDFAASAEPLTDWLNSLAITAARPVSVDVTEAVKRDLKAGRAFAVFRIEPAALSGSPDGRYRAIDFVRESRPAFRPQLNVIRSSEPVK